MKLEKSRCQFDTLGVVGSQGTGNDAPPQNHQWTSFYWRAMLEMTIGKICRTRNLVWYHQVEYASSWSLESSPWYSVLPECKSITHLSHPTWYDLVTYTLGTLSGTQIGAASPTLANPAFHWASFHLFKWFCFICTNLEFFVRAKGVSKYSQGGIQSGEAIKSHFSWWVSLTNPVRMEVALFQRACPPSCRPGQGRQGLGKSKVSKCHFDPSKCQLYSNCNPQTRAHHGWLFMKK